jgi:hypothetical protein
MTICRKCGNQKLFSYPDAPDEVFSAFELDSDKLIKCDKCGHEFTAPPVEDVVKFGKSWAGNKMAERRDIYGGDKDLTGLLD